MVKYGDNYSIIRKVPMVKNNLAIYNLVNCIVEVRSPNDNVCIDLLNPLIRFQTNLLYLLLFCCKIFGRY